MGKQWKQWQTLFSSAPKSLWMETEAMKLEGAYSLKEKLWQTWTEFKKQRHYFANKSLSSQILVFPVVVYRCESLTIKIAECRRIDAFELWCWRRLLRVPWTAKRSNQSILKEINLNIHWKDWCWSSNTLATWCKELTHLKRPWFWERLKAGGKGDNKGWDGWMASPTQTWVWASFRRWTGKPGVRQSMGSQRVGHDWVTELNWGFCSLSHPVESQ